jgi:hypothetical protein
MARARHARFVVKEAKATVAVGFRDKPCHVLLKNVSTFMLIRHG